MDYISICLVHLCLPGAWHKTDIPMCSVNHTLLYNLVSRKDWHILNVSIYRLCTTLSIFVEWYITYTISNSTE